MTRKNEPLSKIKAIFFLKFYKTYFTLDPKFLMDFQGGEEVVLQEFNYPQVFL